MKLLKTLEDNFGFYDSYSNNSVLSGFVVRDSITREREDFEGDIEGMVGAIAQHVLANLAAQHNGQSNKNKWTLQMDDGEVSPTAVSSSKLSPRLRDTILHRTLFKR